MKITKYIPKSVTRAIGRQSLHLQKNSPHILFGIGVIGVGVGVVLACRATLKAGDILDEMNESVASVKKEFGNTEEGQKAVAYAYMVGTTRLVKLYGPSIVVVGGSIAALTHSHVTLTKRNTALTVAYAGVQKAYEDYRARVRSELGEEKELDIYHAVEVDKIKENGKMKAIRTADPNKFSPYARFFDAGSREWCKDPEVNRIFVQAQQNYFNDMLRVKGHVFLNEVYDALDIPRTKAGQVVGWVMGDEGDNYIDFGLFEARNAEFVNAWEANILLDFNVDGVVLDKI